MSSECGKWSRNHSIYLKVNQFLKSPLLVLHDVNLLVLPFIRTIDYHLVVEQLQKVLTKLVVTR